MLTQEQSDIVYSNLTHLKVLSAAGSGKTTVLAARIAQLCANGADPSSMLVITFTRRAGRDLKERLGRDYSSALVGTFHSAILHVLHKNGLQYNVLSEDEADLAVDECAKYIGYMVGGKYKKHSRNYYKREIREVRCGTKDPTPMSRMYQSRLAINGDIDFDGILLEGVRLAKDGAFNWVTNLLVDESQDNEPLQWEFIREISRFANAMVVGDTGQSLYSFRGAVPEYFDQLQWPAMELTESFRFPSNIGAIANNIGATQLRVWSKKPAIPVSVHCLNEIAGLVKHIMSYRLPSEIAVLCRYNEQVEQIRAELTTNGIPVVIPSIQWRGPVHNLLAYLASPGSSTAREKLVSTWRELRPPLIQYLSSDISQPTAASMTREWLSFTDGTTSGVLSSIVIPDSMKSEASSILAEYDNIAISSYAAETSGQEWIAEGSGVNVGTVHWSKGGQWHEVILPFMNKRQWPRNKSTPEELRALYVAATRTIENLHIVHGDNPSEFVEFFNTPLAIDGESGTIQPINGVAQ